MYTENALNEVIERIEASKSRIAEMFDDLQKEIEKEESIIRNNKLDLQGQLQTLKDTKVYMMAIEEANKKIAQEMGELNEEWDDGAIDYETGAYNLDPEALYEKTPDEKTLEQIADAEHFKQKALTEEKPVQEKKKGLLHRKEKKK